MIPADCAATYQVEVLGGPLDSWFVDSFATVRDSVLVEVPAERDPSLPLLDYGGHLRAPTHAATPGETRRAEEDLT